MKRFNEIRYEDPGYPVFKAYIVPYRENNEVKPVRRLRVEDINIWRDVLSELKRFLSDSLNFASQINRKLSETERMELICDLTALFFKLPLIRETVTGTIMPSPLKIYLLCRLIGGEVTYNPIWFAEKSYEREFLEGLEKILPTIQTYDKIEKCWFILPSDTRPSFNTSGLIPHLLLSSALAWTLAVNKGFDREKAAMLRLTAMLHDIGKPFRYFKHVEASMEVSEALLEQLIDRSRLDEIKDFISKHHSGVDTEEARILSDADRIASSIDRVKKLSQQITGQKIEEISHRFNLNPEDAYAVGPKGWAFWREISRSEGTIEELSKAFVEEIRRRLDEYRKPIGGLEGESVDGVELALIDIGGIQSFVYRSEELKSVVAASMVIDLLVMAQIPFLLQKHMVNNEKIWLPYETILYSAGGIVELVIPSKLSSLIKDVCKKIEEAWEEYIPIRFTSTSFKTNYTETIFKLAENIHSEKFEIENIKYKASESKERGVRDLCELCYQAPPKQFIDTPEGRKKVCNTCRTLYGIGKEQHFRTRYSSEIFIGEKKYVPNNVFKIPWEDASQKILELIAGHNKEELDKLGVTGQVKLRGISVVKIDGNLMGTFMATCISPSDAYERSARIDLALKKAVECAVQNLFDGINSISGNEEEAARAVLSVKLGLLYVGGDDSVILAPAWCTPFLALVLSKEFLTNMGNSRGLAIGLAVAPARASIWALISAASELMNEAKSITRVKPSSNAICFDVVESGTLSGSSTKARLESLKEHFLTSQPLLIDGDAKSFEKLLSFALNGYANYPEAFSKCYTSSRVSELCSDQLKNMVLLTQKRIKKIRSIIGKSLSATRSKVEVAEYVPLVTQIYIRRQMERARERNDEETVSIYDAMRELAPSSLNEYSSFSDLDRLVKIIGGGIL